MTVTHALADGGYSDDAELAFIQCFLQDQRLQALLRVNHFLSVCVCVCVCYVCVWSVALVVCSNMSAGDNSVI